MSDSVAKDRYFNISVERAALSLGSVGLCSSCTRSILDNNYIDILDSLRQLRYPLPNDISLLDDVGGAIVDECFQGLLMLGTARTHAAGVTKSDQMNACPLLFMYKKFRDDVYLVLGFEKQWLLDTFVPSEDSQRGLVEYLHWSTEVIAWTQVASALYNLHQLENALVVAHRVYFELLPSLAAAAEVMQSLKLQTVLNLMHPHLDFFELKMFFVLSEGSAECQCVATITNVFVLSDHSPYYSVGLHRLRLIIAAPTVPPGYHEAQLHRQRIIEDLQTYSANILASGYSITLEALQSEGERMPFYMAHQGLNDLQFQISYGAALRALCPELQFISPHVQLSIDRVAAIAPAGNDNVDVNGNKRKLRVAVISAHFDDHSIGVITVQSITHLYQMGQQDGDLEVFVFYVVRGIVDGAGTGGFENKAGANDNSNSIVNFFSRTLGENFVRIPGSIGASRDIISSYKLDFLLFTDLGMEFSTYGMAQSRLATYQAAWWGHPVTSGLPTIDFYFGLDEELPDAIEEYSEQLVRMTWMHSAPLTKGAESVDLPSLGFPVISRLCVVVGRLFKLHPEFDIAIANIILDTDSDVFVAFIAESIYAVNQIIVDRLRAVVRQGYHEMVSLNNNSHLPPVETFLQRIKFVDYKSYFGIILAARVVLDTFPYGGCLSSHDALASGIPIVTYPSKYIRGRYTLAMYQQMGYTDLVATSLQHYIEIALNLLNDDEYWRYHVDRTQKAYATLNHNRDVAMEWKSFIQQLF